MALGYNRVNWASDFGQSREDILETLFSWLPALHRQLGMSTPQGTLIDYLKAAPPRFNDQNTDGCDVMEYDGLGLFTDDTRHYISEHSLGFQAGTLFYEGFYSLPANGEITARAADTAKLLVSFFLDGRKTQAVFGDMRLPKEIQQTGLGRDLCRAVLRTCLKLGCATVYLDDVQDTGSYFWLRADAEVLNKSRAFKKLQIRLNELDMPSADREALQDLIDTKDPARLSEIAAYHTPDRKLGWELTRKQQLDTLRIDFNDARICSGLKNYLGFDVEAERTALAKRPIARTLQPMAMAATP